MSKARFFLPAAVYYVLIFFLSSQSRIRIPPIFPWIDKGLHLVLYAGFGACLAWGFVRLGSHEGRPPLGLILLLGTGLAGLDEIHQIFVPGRFADLADLAADFLGILAGWAFLRAALRCRASRRRRRAAKAATQP